MTIDTNEKKKTKEISKKDELNIDEFTVIVVRNMDGMTHLSTIKNDLLDLTLPDPVYSYGRNIRRQPDTPNHRHHQFSSILQLRKVRCRQKDRPFRRRPHRFCRDNIRQQCQPGQQGRHFVGDDEERCGERLVIHDMNIEDYDRSSIRSGWKNRTDVGRPRDEGVVVVLVGRGECCCDHNLQYSCRGLPSARHISPHHLRQNVVLVGRVDIVV